MSASPAAELAIRDVRNVTDFARKFLNGWLARRSATLSPAELEDALAYLIVLAYELERSFNENLGWSYSKFLYTRFNQRLVDYYRKRFGDRRYAVYTTEVVAPGDAKLDRQQGDVAGEALEHLALDAMLETPSLSEGARETLREVVLPLSEGLTYQEIAERLRVSRQAIARRMRDLRTEIRVLGGPAAVFGVET